MTSAVAHSSRQASRNRCRVRTAPLAHQALGHAGFSPASRVLTRRPCIRVRDTSPVRAVKTRAHACHPRALPPDSGSRRMSRPLRPQDLPGCGGCPLRRLYQHIAVRSTPVHRTPGCPEQMRFGARVGRLRWPPSSHQALATAASARREDQAPTRLRCGRACATIPVPGRRCRSISLAFAV